MDENDIPAHQPRTPMDMADAVLAWVEEQRPSSYVPWLAHEVRELAVMLAKWRAEIVAGERGEQ